MPSEVIQETEEEEISDDEKSDERNCFDMHLGKKYQDFLK